ncbi:LOW QUALITY PROTEIN: putative inhibitor of apoptosis [Sander lucioperca]|uniref:LOW QUALITY PROTEIN: putative inhibitor of apoptosis n=1 Tax=Sander lucioperca TaxID=283035 RepID=UPI0016537CA6|nr:LOW QUALITY PROTEIN: putative inhibitor of apoptosis [Sander lucioperca]
MHLCTHTHTGTNIVFVEPAGYLNMSFTAPPPSSPLSSGLEDMSHQRPTCHNPSMRREQDCQDSFHPWTLSIITPDELAKAGFYFLGQGDRVACFSCGGQLSNWEPGDRALCEHQKHYPNCRFVRGDRAAVSASGGVISQLSSAASTFSNVSNPAMQQSDERLLTFVNWPSCSPVRPDQQAKAGFYYVGRNDDVKCFCCDGGLRCWESGDDAWVEHAKWFPLCEYLLQEKGQEFVHQIQAHFPRLFEQVSREQHRNMLVVQIFKVLDQCRGPEKGGGARDAGAGYGIRWFHFCEETPGSFDPASEECGVSAGAFKSEKNIIPAATEEYSGLKAQTSPQQQTARLIELVLNKGNAAAEVFRSWIQKNDVHLLRDLMAQSNEAASPSEDLSEVPMEEQMWRLQEERTCMVCMDKEVNIVFIPCGHLVVCKECAPSLRKCPICRALVKGTVRTFLS